LIFRTTPRVEAILLQRTTDVPKEEASLVLASRGNRTAACVSSTVTSRRLSKETRTLTTSDAVLETTLVVGTVASASFASALKELASSAWVAGGFECTVVSAFDYFETLNQPRIQPLPPPERRLLPCQRWCEPNARDHRRIPHGAVHISIEFASGALCCRMASTC
jgi:hypothetical protein